MWKVDSNFTWALQKARLRIYLSLLSTYYLNIFNNGQIILNKHLFKRVCNFDLLFYFDMTVYRFLIYSTCQYIEYLLHNSNIGLNVLLLSIVKVS